MRQFPLASALFVALAGAPALSDDAALPQARALIEQQFVAFEHDDADGAFALAAPGLRAIFPNSVTFLSMVRESYAPVYRHREADFGAFADSGDTIQQSVTLIDNDNEVWTAIYTLEKQPGGDWRISGCVLAKSTETSV